MTDRACAVCHEALAGSSGIGFGCDVGHLLHPACMLDLLRHTPGAGCPSCRRGNGVVFQIKAEYAALLFPDDDRKRRAEDEEAEALCLAARTALFPEKCRSDLKMGMFHSMPQHVLVNFAHMGERRRRAVPRHARALERLRRKRRRLEERLDALHDDESRLWAQMTASDDDDGDPAVLLG